TPNTARYPPGTKQIKDFLTGGPESHDYNRAVLTAGLKWAARLGRTAREATPDDVETFELAPCDPALPRVVCLLQEVTATPFLYGVHVSLPLGARLHPNEFFDGAVVRWNRGYVGSTYGEQNHPVLVERCRRHGRDLNFVGCILFGGTTVSSAEKEASASAVANMARVLRAEAALVVGLN